MSSEYKVGAAPQGALAPGSSHKALTTASPQARPGADPGAPRDQQPQRLTSDVTDIIINAQGVSLRYTANRGISRSVCVNTPGATWS